MYFLNTKDRYTLISSNAPIEDYPAWDSSQIYNTGDIVIYQNKIWESAIDNNDSEPGTDVNWIDKGYTNPYRCLDEYINTQTEKNDGDPLVMEFNIKNSNAITLLNTECKKIQVDVYDINGNLVLTYIEDVISGISSWKDYFFGDIVYKNKLIIKGPILLKGKIKLTVYGQNIKVGIVLIGLLEDLGVTLTRVTTSIDDYSKKDVDKNGNVYLKQGNYADRLETKVLLNNSDFNVVKNKLVNIRATPIYFMSSDCDIYEELNVYGYYENFKFSIDNNKKTTCSLSIRGLI